MSSRDGLFRMVFVTVAWAAVLWLLSKMGMRILPMAIARHLSLQAYLTLVQLTALAFGLVLTVLLVRDRRRALALKAPTPIAITALVLITPALFVITSYTAIAASVSLLLEELRAGGRELAQRNTGQFGAELAQAPVLLTLLWGAVVSPVCEEVFFRGMLWSTIQRGIEAVWKPKEVPPPSEDRPWIQTTALDRVSSWFKTGGIATLVSTAIFGAAHADMAGGLGRVRFVSALGLGLCAALARQHTGSIAAAIVLHVVFNTCSIATSRRWVVTETFPVRLGVPTMLSLVSVACIVLFAFVLLGRQRWKAASMQ